MGPFCLLNYKEYTIIQTPEGPIVLISPHLSFGLWGSGDPGRGALGVGAVEEDTVDGQNPALP